MSKAKKIISSSFMIAILLSLLSITAYAAYNMSYSVQNDFWSGSCSTWIGDIKASYVEQSNCEYLTTNETTYTYGRLDYDVDDATSIGMMTDFDTDYLFYNGGISTGSSGADPYYRIDYYSGLSEISVYFDIDGSGYVDFYLPLEWQGMSGEYEWYGTEGYFYSPGYYSNNFFPLYDYEPIYLSSGNL